MIPKSIRENSYSDWYGTNLLN